MGEFLSQYYQGQEYKGGPLNLINNIDDYIKLNECANISKSTKLTSRIIDSVSTIPVENTEGFPDHYGLLKINDEIITYKSKTSVSFVECSRGFSGITSFTNSDNPEDLIFSTSNVAIHEDETVVENLSNLFLEKFLEKVKKQFLYGFDTNLHSDINQNLFIKQSKDFYSTRGTDESFKILFGALYSEKVDIIRPRDYVISPSNANYKLARDLIVEPVEGDVTGLVNNTLFQDAFENITKAYAPVSDVEKVVVGVLTNTYWKISIDGSYSQNDGSTDLIYGEFVPNAKTKIIGKVGVAQTYLDVDSTLGFPNSGTLSYRFEDGTVGVCTYAHKTINQFLGINTTGIGKTIRDNTAIDQDTYSYSAGAGKTDGIKVKIRAVLNNLDIPKETYYQKSGSKVKLISLGKIGKDNKVNNWLFNTSQSYVVEKLEIIDSINFLYKLTTKDKNILRIGDKVTTHLTVNNTVKWGSPITSEFEPSTGREYNVNDIFDEYSCLIQGTGITDVSKVVKVTRLITKADSTIHPRINEQTANVQNVYLDGKNTLVASSSIPYSGKVKLNPKRQKFDNITGTYNKGDTIIKISSGIDHNFRTGDMIYYTPQFESKTIKLPNGKEEFIEWVESSLFEKGTNNDYGEGIYYVERIDDNNVKFAKSRSNLYNEIYASVTTDGGVDNVTIVNNIVEKYEFYNKRIESQKLLRKIDPVTHDGKFTTTMPGYTGILVDGVEILNYKSTDFVYYGNIDSIDVVKGGKNYDVINPPKVAITDSVGTGATGTASVKGNFKEIRLLKSGFDYLDVPIVKITGGNGSGAVAEAKLVTVPHQRTFDSTGIGSDTTGIGTVIIGASSNQSTIGFSTYHKFREGERVVYKTFGEKSLAGLGTDSIYYVSLSDDFTVKLHKTYNEAIAGLGTVTFTAYGKGTHALKSLNGKAVVSSISIIDPGSNYENKERTCVSIGINTALNTINIPNHGFKDREVIKYSNDLANVGSGTTTLVTGLSTAKDYYISIINENSFQLAAVGVGTTVPDFYLNTKQFADLSSVGFGTHKFNYPPIQVQIEGTVGISSISGDTFEASVQPIVRGEITSINLTDNGAGYGVTNVLNFERDPQVEVFSGQNAVLTPVISGGKIVDVSVSAAGTNYNAPPNLAISGIGTGAELVPEVNALGNIVSVKVQHGGLGYGVSTTFIQVDAAGQSAKFKPHLESWQLNKVRRNEDNISDDDVFLSLPLNSNFGLQCSYAYAPRSLRKILYATDQDGQILFGAKDLRLVNNIEVDNTQHSPIIGWAYDGHPIYGPYGYSSQTGGAVVQMKSGYLEQASLVSGRPPVSEFPAGFFIEDYKYIPSDDESVLDENNGRFCVTPEFPKGTYAYFATFEKISSSSGIFEDYKAPSFPYLIGNSYNSKPNAFNFKRKSNQDDLNLNNTQWVRNTYPYALNKKYSGYSYVSQSYDYVPQDSTIDFAKKGTIDAIGILTGGTGYAVNDKVVFDKAIKNNFNASAKVAKVASPGIGTVSVTNTTFSDIEFYPLAKENSRDTLVGIYTDNLGLFDKSVVSIAGINTTASNVDGTYHIGISTNLLTVTSAISTEGVTGIVTYFSVGGEIKWPFIKENDLYKVGTEEIKVLNIDELNSRLRVLRLNNAVSGVSHTITTVLTELPRKFTIQPSGGTTSYPTRMNKEVYFDARESVAIGTAQPFSVVGVGSTLRFANPGAGITELFAPLQTLYLPKHGLVTGDKVTYQADGSGDYNIGIITSSNQVATGDSFSLSDYSSLWVAKISDHYIGLSTVKVGMGSTGSFAGIADTTTHQGLVYFNHVGLGGTTHSLKTDFNVVKGDLERNLVTVKISAGATHGLSNDDTISMNINPGISTTTTLKYNLANRKVIVNPLGFSTSGIVTTTSATGIPDSININDHNLTTGQKVIYTENDTGTAIAGLTDETQYYVYVVDRNYIKLTENKYETTQSIPVFVGLTTAGEGTLSPVNPPLRYYKNSNVTFDLTDSSLSYTQSTTNYAAFKLEFYEDSNFTVQYNTNGVEDDKFNITETGTVGVTTDAKSVLKVDADTPDILYYKLVPIDSSQNTVINKEIVVDDTVDLNNQIIFEKSIYNGDFKVTKLTDQVFTYNLGERPERSEYTPSPAHLDYITNSSTAYGRIAEIKLSDKGGGYADLPGITTVTTTTGTGAELEVSSKTIGKVVRTSIDNIGFDYPSDLTLDPSALFPQVLKVEPLTGFDAIGITSFGIGYNTNPSLIVLDGSTKEQIKDVDLLYNREEKKVEILKNSYSLSNTPPTIIPVGNPNGVRASGFTFNREDTSTTSSTTSTVYTNIPTVTVTLSESFNSIKTAGGDFKNPFPFAINDEVLVENVSVGVGSTSKGYNSSQYEYARFKIVEVTPNYGGIGTVKYRMDGYLLDDEWPGVYDSIESAGMLIPTKWFPHFDATLKPNAFNKEDEVRAGDKEGTVFEWNSSAKFLTVESNEEFEIGEILIADDTGAQGRIKEVVSFESKYDLDDISTTDNGWEYLTGFLNNELQKTPDNDYYQSFSYSIKSKVQFEEWKNIVGSLNHTAGFKKFSDLQVESSLGSDIALQVGITTEVTRVLDLHGLEDINRVRNFDLATENFLTGVSRAYSDEINFKTRLITDYSESIGNRVLVMDDVSGEFNSNPRSTPYSDVWRQRLSDGRSQAFIIYIQDRLYTGERQILRVNAVHDTGRGISMLNQYGDVWSVLDLGDFDYVIDGADSILRFYPHKFKLNNYNVVPFVFNVDKNILGITTSQIGVSVGSTEIPAAPANPSTGLNGSLVSIASTVVEIAGGAAGTVFTLAGIGTTISGHRSAKIFMSIEASDGSVEHDELTVIHDGTNVGWQEYGQLTIHSLDPYSTGNIGTYWPYMSGNDLIVSYTPEAGYTTSWVNAVAIGIATEGYQGIGTYDFSYGSMRAQSTGIVSSSTPSAVGIASYHNDYDAAYCVVQIANVLDGNYEIAEVIVVDDYADDSQVMLTEYGNVKVGTTNAGMGTISGRRAADDNTEITFVPHAGIGVSITTFMTPLRPEINGTLLPAGATRAVGGETKKDLGNAQIGNDINIYEGTEAMIKRQFALKHNTDPIFRRNFDGSSTSVVDLTNNTILLPNHFWVTGEEIVYSVKTATGVGTTGDTIGISKTEFSGVGTVTYIPGQSVYVIKKGENKIQLARSAEDALKEIAVPLDLTAVGVGTSHSITSKNQNTKVMVGIDNMIQSPIGDTTVSTTLDRDAALGTDVIYFTGITSIFGADYVRVGTATTYEVMKILSVGIGSTNAIKVQRGWLGSTIVGHSTGDTVTKIRGNYDIKDNYINFMEAPPGKNPVGSVTNPPDDRDWTGITTSSSFHGRSFMRSGVENGTSETYTLNYQYDDLSNQFTGQDKDFNLTVDGSNVTGIATNNAIVLINSIFQGPGNSVDYTMDQSGGVSEIAFTGGIATNAYDPNTATIPVGGLIVSIGSSKGFGYQPLVAAGGTVTVSIAGTIASIGIGTSGSGYRAGIQTVTVGIQTESMGAAGITSVGVAAVSNGQVTGVTITNPQCFYKPRDIRMVSYGNTTGLTTVTTATPHGLSRGSDIVLSGIAFTCGYSTAVGIATADYDSSSGIMTVTTLYDHGLSATGTQKSTVVLTGLAMTCGLGATVNHIYPRNKDIVYNTAVGIKSDGTPYTVTNALYSPITGLTTVTVASHGFSNLDYVRFLDGSLTFTCAKDNNATNHSYPRSTDPVHGEWLPITNVTSDTFQVNVLGIGTTGTASAAPSTNTSAHTFVSATTGGLIHNDGTITLDVTAALPASDRYEHTFVSADSNAVVSGGNYTHTFDSATTNGVTVTGVGAFTPTAATYTPSTGNMVLTIAGHSYNTSQTVSFATGAITFTCEMDDDATTHSYPRAGDPVAGIVTAITATTTNTITVNVGASPLVNYTPTNATYDEDSGEMVLTIGTHGLQDGKSVRLADESITFTCTKDDNATNHSYPRARDPYYQTAVGIASTSSTTITLNVGAALAGNQYPHTFVGAAASTIITGANYSHAFRWATKDGVTSSGNTSFTATDATYNAVTGDVVLTIYSHGLNAPSTSTATTATYDPVVGIVTLTVADHGFTNGDFVKLADDSLTFSCVTGSATKTYPRSTDPISGKWIAISGVTTDTFAIQVLDNVPSTNTGIHTFISATSNGISHARDLVGIGTSSLAFACEMDQYGTDHAYPRASDPIAGINTVITAASTNTITINVGTSPVGFNTVTAATYYQRTGDIMLTLMKAHTLTTENSVRLKTEGLRFTCTKDSNATQHRYPRGGDPGYDGMQVAGVGSARNFSIYVGTSTVPTNYVSGGTVQACIYAPRNTDLDEPGVTVNKVLDDTTFEVQVGLSSRHHIYNRGGSVNQQMKVVFDEPIGYSDIPLVYSADSPGSGGAQATADIVVGQGSTVIDFTLTNVGYGYGANHIITPQITGALGIPTFTNFVPSTEFQMTVEEVHNDQWNAWSVGQLQVIDDFSSLFNGKRKTFPIELSGTPLSIQARPGSTVTIQDCLLIFINDILQIPGESYDFTGGSNISFTEAPKAEDTMKFIFYRGTGGADVIDKDIIETVKVGDDLTLGWDADLTAINKPQESWLQEGDRTVDKINSANSCDTNPYDGPGVYEETTVHRPIDWVRQVEDKFIGGKKIGKDRVMYKASLFPRAYLTQNVGVGTTVIYVDSVRPFFNAANENKVSTDFQKDVELFNNKEVVSAAATAIVSAAGTIQSISISGTGNTAGRGYSSAPDVTIQNPVGVGTTARAEASATISGGAISAITVGIRSGIGYTGTNPPLVLVGPPVDYSESNSVDSYAGDEGLITGIGTTTIAGVASTAIVFDMVIPSDSWLRDSDITQPAVATVCGLSTGDYFLVYNSNTGPSYGVTSLQSDNSICGVGTTGIDNVYRVAHHYSYTGDAIGFGNTTMVQVVASVSSIDGVTAVGSSSFYGEYSWGRVILSSRAKSQSFTVNTTSGISGIETGPVLQRVKPLRIENYDT